MGNNVNVTATLLNSYFNTAWIKTYGTNPVLNSMVQRKSWKMGMHYVEELVGNFAQGGPNLAVADCGRGREAGFNPTNTFEPPCSKGSPDQFLCGY